MIRDKIKALMLLNGKSSEDIYNGLGIFKQAFSRKMTHNSFRCEDLIKIGKITGCTLAFIDKDDKVVIRFDEKDIT